MFENPTVNPNVLCNLCMNIKCCLSWLIFTFPYARSSIQNVSKQFISCIDLSFVKFALHPTWPIKIQWAQGARFKQLYLSNHSELATCSFEFFFFNNDQYYHLPKQWPFLLNHLVLEIHIPQISLKFLDFYSPLQRNF
jgi:hypothetical protein